MFDNHLIQHTLIDLSIYLSMHLFVQRWMSLFPVLFTATALTPLLTSAHLNKGQFTTKLTHILQEEFFFAIIFTLNPSCQAVTG